MSGADKVSRQHRRRSPPRTDHRTEPANSARRPSCSPSTPAATRPANGTSTPAAAATTKASTPSNGPRAAKQLGAGEILLTSMDTDGVQDGFDCALTRAVSRATHIPVIASGGAGKPEHFVRVLTEG